jgi:GT2 family glycosyltransferase
MQDIVQIVILSRDRPEYLKEAIDSVLSQNLSTAVVKIVVSDNSEKNEVEVMISRNYSDNNIKYIRRFPSVSIVKHCQLVVSECKEKYVVLFHDDDIMHPDYVETMLPFMQQEDVSAVGCNEFIFSNDFTKSTLGKPHKFNSPKIFNNEKDFLEQYIPGVFGIAAFPGHMYNTECLKKIELNNVRRKGEDGYSDTLLLNSLLEYGRIIWIPNFLIYYRVGNSKESDNLYMAEHISVLNRMSHVGLDKDGIAVSMRFAYLLRWFLLQDIKKVLLWKNRTIFKYLFFKSFSLSLQANSWKLLFNNYYIRRIFSK